MKQSTTLSMGTTIAGNPYLIQAAEYITPGLPYFAAIGIDDEDRHIRERVQTACETVGYAWPEGRTTLALMPTNQPKRPGLCALATAVCIMATAGTIGIPDLENTVILGDVTADGTIPPLGEDVDLTALIEHAEAMHVHCVILPAADLAQAGTNNTNESGTITGFGASERSQRCKTGFRSVSSSLRARKACRCSLWVCFFQSSSFAHIS